MRMKGNYQVDGTDKLYELMFSEFIRLLLRDSGIRN